MNNTEDKNLDDDSRSSSEESSSSSPRSGGVLSRNNQRNRANANHQLKIKNQENTEETDEMKRAAAKKLIERYFYQLIDGCGNPKCNNKYCASSGEVGKLTPNAAAARAIQLFSQEAKLCEIHPSKVARTNANSMSASSTSSDESQNLASLDLDDSVDKPITGSAVDTDDPMMDKEEKSAKSLDSKTSNLNSKNGENEKNLASKVSRSSHHNRKVLNATVTEPQNRKIDYLDEAKLNKLIETCKKDGNFSLLIRTLGGIFSTRESVALSFQRQPASSIDEMLQKAPDDLKNLKKEDLRTLEGDLDKDEDSTAEKKEKEEILERHHTNVDLISLRRTIKNLYEANSELFEPLNNALQSLSTQLSVEIRMFTTKEQIEENITVFVILFEILQIGCSELEPALPHICGSCAHLPVWAQARLASIWAKYCKEGLRSMLEQLQQLITITSISMPMNCFPDVKVQDNETVCNATKVMKIIFYANILAGQVEPSKYREEDINDIILPAYLSLIPEDEEEPAEKKERRPRLEDPLAKELDVNILDCRHPYLPYEEFYNEPLSEIIEMDHDYMNYKNATSDMHQALSGSSAGSSSSSNGPKKFTFMLYSYILTPATKTLALYYDSRIRMYSERRLSLIQQYTGGLANINPYFKLKIRRDHIIEDALVEVEVLAMTNPKELKKQLVVEFDGEQGIDEGGVSKEFFQLIIEEIFNPDFGMFINNEDTNTVWFNSTSFENEAQFTLVGIVLGLAIYNNIILAVNFPMVVYRKLMGMKGSFPDLEDWNPTLYNSLKSMLDYQENDMEEVFMQTFKISYKDIFGTTLDHELKPDGDKILVNQDNKQEFVDMYADFLLNESIEKQFKAFKRGFHMVTDESPLHLLFRPEEIELIVCGSKNFDFNELEQSTEYEGGYTAESQTIKDFWDIVHGFSMDLKQKLLQFTTGSDRIPVGGLSRLKLVIARNGPDCDRLPTSHTCFNVLLLPEYSSRQKLQERLLKAINYSKGFGML